MNVSAHQLMAPDFPATVASVLADTKTDPELVTLEVTESVFLRDSERALVALNDLKQIGVMLALDDFGTGYSSLSYLKRFPVDVVKIDRVFISDLDHNPDSRLIVNAVVALAHGLCMSVVAEGVESVEQYKEVAALDCDSCQGFYFAPTDVGGHRSTRCLAERRRLQPPASDRSVARPGSPTPLARSIAPCSRAATIAVVRSPRVRSSTARNASVVRRSPPVTPSG